MPTCSAHRPRSWIAVRQTWMVLWLQQPVTEAHRGEKKPSQLRNTPKSVLENVEAPCKWGEGWTWQYLKVTWKVLPEEMWDDLSTSTSPTHGWTKPVTSWSPQVLLEESWDARLAFISPTHHKASRNLVPQVFVWDSAVECLYAVACYKKSL